MLKWLIFKSYWFKQFDLLFSNFEFIKINLNIYIQFNYNNNNKFSTTIQKSRPTRRPRARRLWQPKRVRSPRLHRLHSRHSRRMPGARSERRTPGSVAHGTPQRQRRCRRHRQQCKHALESRGAVGAVAIGHREAESHLWQLPEDVAQHGALYRHHWRTAKAFVVLCRVSG